MTPAEKKAALRAELLIDPNVLAPGPDLSPIKPFYRVMIQTEMDVFNRANPLGPVAVYGHFTDLVLERHFAQIEDGIRPIDITADALRQPLLRGSWGKIELVAAQVPEYYGLPVGYDLERDTLPAPDPKLAFAQARQQAQARTRARMPRRIYSLAPSPRAPAATPILNSLVPDTSRAGDPDFTIHYHGRDFIETGSDRSIAHWDGAAVATTFISTTELTSLVRSTLEPAARTYQVFINSGGRLSAALPFTYTNPAPALDTKVKRNIYCRNLMILLQDPATVHLGERYHLIRDTLTTLVADGLIAQAEMSEILALMLGGPVTHAYNKRLVDHETETATAAEISVALRVP